MKKNEFAAIVKILEAHIAEVTEKQNIAVKNEDYKSVGVLHGERERLLHVYELFLSLFSPKVSRG